MNISIGLIAALLFLCFVLAVALVIVVLLLRDISEKQKVYGSFSNYLNEFLIIISQEGRLLDVFPKYISDPLYEQLCQKQSLKRILSISEYRRLQEYVRGLDAYPEIPFIFSFNTETGVQWYELRAFIRKKNGEIKTILFFKNVSIEMETRNQRDRLQENEKLLLQSTGDFLWSLDVDSRQFSFLTPLLDQNGLVVPRTLGKQNIREMMPEEDYALFEKLLNARVVAFRTTGNDIEDRQNILLRLRGADGLQTWFSFCGKLCAEEGSKMVFRGAARRMELLQENFGDDENEDLRKLLSMAMSFPDVRLFLIDRDYRICGCNLAFSLAFGMADPKDVEGKRLIEVVRPRYFTVFHGFISEALERGIARSWKGPFGVEDRLLWLNAVPLRGTDGLTNRVLGVYMQLDKKEFEHNHSTYLEV